MAKEKSKVRLIEKIIWFSIIGIIATFALVTGFTKTKAAPKLDKPYSIQIIAQGGIVANDRIDLGQDNSYKEELDMFYKTYQDSVDFSALRGILENQWFKKAYISTYVDDNGDKQLKTLDKNQLLNIKAEPTTQKDASKILIAFRYIDQDGEDAKKTITIDGIQITYDTVYFMVRHTQNQIASFRMYFIDSKELAANDFYKTYEITAYGQLTKMYTLIQDILEK